MKEGRPAGVFWTDSRGPAKAISGCGWSQAWRWSCHLGPQRLSFADRREAGPRHGRAGAFRLDTLRRARGLCAELLATGHALVVLEHLKTKNMTRSAKGTLEQPGRDVRAKSGLVCHAGQGMAPVRAGLDIGGPLHGHDGGESAGGVHVATVLEVWACTPEIPREPTPPLRTRRVTRLECSSFSHGEDVSSLLLCAPLRARASSVPGPMVATTSRWWSSSQEPR